MRPLQRRLMLRRTADNSSKPSNSSAETFRSFLKSTPQSRLRGLRVAMPVHELNDPRREVEQKRIKVEVGKALGEASALTRAVAEIEHHYRAMPKRGDRDEHR